MIGGNGKDVGKTSLVCAVIRALPEVRWTAVKITGHDYDSAGVAMARSGDSRCVIREETHAGQDTDTARYLAAGARRALLVTRSGAEVAIRQVRRAIGDSRNVIFESNRIVESIRPDVCLALMGNATDRKPSFLHLLRTADAVVNAGEIEDVPEGIRSFRLESVDRLSPEMAEWLKERLRVLG